MAAFFPSPDAEALPTMLILRGAPALSVFRRQRLLQAVQGAVPTVTGLYAEFMHFADLSEALGGDERQVLESILRYGPSAQAEQPAGQLLLVQKRLERGTAEQVQRIVDAIGQGNGCLFVYSGPTIFYPLTGRCSSVIGGAEGMTTRSGFWWTLAMRNS